MFNSTFKKAAMFTLAAAVLATSVSTTPANAGGGRDPEKKVSTISTTNADGSKTSIRSQNGAKTYTVTRTKNGKVVNKKRVNKNRKPFITIFNPDGTSKTVRGPAKKRADSATRHFPDGTSRTVTTPSKPRSAFITIFNADGTSHTAGKVNR